MDTSRIYIKELTLKDYKCFKGENRFPFYRANENGQKIKVFQWTVFLGNNGTGKTNLLKALANLEPVLVDNNVDTQKKEEDVQNLYVSLQMEQGEKQLSKDRSKDCKYKPKVIERFPSGNYDVSAGFAITHQQKSLVKSECKTLLSEEMTFTLGNKLYTGGTETKIGYGAHVNNVDPTAELSEVKIYAYGVERKASKTGLNTELGDTAISMFRDDVRLLNFEDWLLQLELAKSNPKMKSGAEKILKVLGDIFSKSTLMPAITGFKLHTDESYNNRILFECKDGDFKFEDLGYGYQCMLAWVFDFCKRMFDRYPDSPNPLKEAAVVIIDELDLHLHPKWQRGLLKALSKMFPATQFIVSTHSPMIIQSMDGINLFVLRHQEDGSVKVTRMENMNWEGWQMEEILQETMDVENGYTSEELGDKIEHFNKACSEENLTKAENLLNELERTVNPNGSLMQMLKMQIRDLRNYKSLG